MQIVFDDGSEVREFPGAIFALDKSFFRRIKSSRILKSTRKIHLYHRAGSSPGEDRYAFEDYQALDGYKRLEIRELFEEPTYGLPGLFVLQEYQPSRLEKYTNYLRVIDECYFPLFIWLEDGNDPVPGDAVKQLASLNSSVFSPGDWPEESDEPVEQFVQAIRHLTGGLINTKMSDLVSAWRGRHTRLERMECSQAEVSAGSWFGRLDKGGETVSSCAVLLSGKTFPPLPLLSKIYRDLASIWGEGVQLLGNGCCDEEQQAEIVITLFITCGV